MPASLAGEAHDPIDLVQEAIDRFKEAQMRDAGKLDRSELVEFACSELAKHGEPISGRRVHRLIGHGRSNDVCTDVRKWQLDMAQASQTGIAPSHFPESARRDCEAAFASIYKACNSAAVASLEVERQRMANTIAQHEGVANEARHSQQIAEARLSDSLTREESIKGQLLQAQQENERLANQLAAATEAQMQLREQLRSLSTMLDEERRAHEATRGRVDAALIELQGVRRHILHLQDQQAEVVRTRDASIAEMKDRLIKADERAKLWTVERDQLIIARTSAEGEMKAQARRDRLAIEQLISDLEVYRAKDADHQRKVLDDLVRQARDNLRSQLREDEKVFEVIDLVDGSIVFDSDAPPGQLGQYWLENCDGLTLTPRFNGELGSARLIAHIEANYNSYQALIETMDSGDDFSDRLSRLVAPGSESLR